MKSANPGKMHLHTNQLTKLGGNTFQPLTNLEVLTLYNNLLVCECSLHPFVEWLNQTKSNVIGATCNDTNIQVTDFPYSKCYDEGVNATEITEFVPVAGKDMFDHSELTNSKSSGV
ncbi:Hypothetical predicted protein [Mytilus galloprovincialis]|uniref:LRRCT domain-containing protein n=1 Tax=Mytilus galloprovincialis TaxID=29158 RepID=A0A8B6C4S4_MYTGA|nr:Hypothetical predicted protein [Mytilus galloprovincialis]